MAEIIEDLKKIEPPTFARFIRDEEWNICQKVYGDTLPFRYRILITNALGAQGRPFTIPTSIFPAGAATFLGGAVGFAAGVIGSVGNVGYLVNVGAEGEKSMSTRGETERLLVHEMCHVWQGYNSVFALSYVMDSAISQCSLPDAYAVSPNPQLPWENYNAEQQAKIVDQWYITDHMSDTSPRFKYIKYYLRKGSNSGDVTDIAGIWKVTTNGSSYFYWFKESGYCKWFYKLPTVLTNYAPVDGSGEYKMNGSQVEINWDSGSRERWNLPLSEKSQSGTWFAADGRASPITAVKNPSG